MARTLPTWVAILAIFCVSTQSSEILNTEVIYRTINGVLQTFNRISIGWSQDDDPSTPQAFVSTTGDLGQTKRTYMTLGRPVAEYISHVVGFVFEGGVYLSHEVTLGFDLPEDNVPLNQTNLPLGGDSFLNNTGTGNGLRRLLSVEDWKQVEMEAKRQKIEMARQRRLQRAESRRAERIKRRDELLGYTCETTLAHHRRESRHSLLAHMKKARTYDGVHIHKDAGMGYIEKHVPATDGTTKHARHLLIVSDSANNGFSDFASGVQTNVGSDSENLALSKLGGVSYGKISQDTKSIHITTICGGSGVCSNTFTLQKSIILDELGRAMDEVNAKLLNVYSRFDAYQATTSARIVNSESQIMQLATLANTNVQTLTLMQGEVEAVKELVVAKTNELLGFIIDSQNRADNISSYLVALTSEMKGTSNATILAINELWGALNDLNSQFSQSIYDINQYKAIVSQNFADVSKAVVEARTFTVERRALIGPLQDGLQDLMQRGYIPFVSDVGKLPAPLLDDSDPRTWTIAENAWILALSPLAPSPAPVSMLGTAYKFDISFEFRTSFYISQPQFTRSAAQFFSILGANCNDTSTTNDDGCAAVIRVRITQCEMNLGTTNSSWIAADGLNSTICNGAPQDVYSPNPTRIFKNFTTFLSSFIATDFCSITPTRWLKLDPHLQYAPDHQYRLISLRKGLRGFFFANPASCQATFATLSTLSDPDPTLSPQPTAGSNVLFALYSVLGDAMSQTSQNMFLSQNDIEGELPNKLHVEQTPFVRNPGDPNYGIRTIGSVMTYTDEMVPIIVMVRASFTAPLVATKDDNTTVLSTSTAIQYNWDSLMPSQIVCIGLCGGQIDPQDPTNSSNWVVYDYAQASLTRSTDLTARCGSPMYPASPAQAFVLDQNAAQAGLTVVNTTAYNIDTWETLNLARFDQSCGTNVPGSRTKARLVKQPSFTLAGWQGSTFKGCENGAPGEGFLCTLLDIFDVVEPAFQPASWNPTTGSFPTWSTLLLPRIYDVVGTIDTQDGPYTQEIISLCPVVSQVDAAFGQGYDLTLTNPSSETITLHMTVNYGPVCTTITSPIIRTLTIGSGNSLFGIRVSRCGESNATVAFSRLNATGGDIPCDTPITLDMSHTDQNIAAFAGQADAAFVRFTVDTAFSALQMNMLNLYASSQEQLANALVRQAEAQANAGFVFPRPYYDSLVETIANLSVAQDQRILSLQASINQTTYGWNTTGDDIFAAYSNATKARLDALFASSAVALSNLDTLANLTESLRFANELAAANLTAAFLGLYNSSVAFKEALLNAFKADYKLGSPEIGIGDFFGWNFNTQWLYLVAIIIIVIIAICALVMCMPILKSGCSFTKFAGSQFKDLMGGMGGMSGMPGGGGISFAQFQQLQMQISQLPQLQMQVVQLQQQVSMLQQAQQFARPMQTPMMMAPQPQQMAMAVPQQMTIPMATPAIGGSFRMASMAHDDSDDEDDARSVDSDRDTRFIKRRETQPLMAS